MEQFIKSEEPDLAVAFSAAILAAKLIGVEEKFIIKEVLPQTLVVCENNNFKLSVNRLAPLPFSVTLSVNIDLNQISLHEVSK